MTVDGEMEMLRRLCDETLARDERQALIESLAAGSFAVPEHQVVYESIRAVWPITIERLRVHLNNRGFPDIDVEAYFPARERKGR